MRFLFSIGLFAALALIGCADEPPGTADRPATAAETRQEFEARYRAWQEKIERDFGSSSSLKVYKKCDEYERLVDLGPRAVPFFVEKIDESQKRLPGSFYGCFLDDAVERIVCKKFKDCTEVVPWWQSRGEVPERFRQAYEQWKRLKGDGPPVLEVVETVYDDRSKRLQTRRTKTELGKAYFTIRELGIDALPLIVEKLKAGDYDLLPIFGEMAEARPSWLLSPFGEAPRKALNPPTGAGSLDKQAESALAWWELNREDWLLPPAPAPQPKEKKP